MNGFFKWARYLRICLRVLLLRNVLVDLYFGRYIFLLFTISPNMYTQLYSHQIKDSTTIGQCYSYAIFFLGNNLHSPAIVVFTTLGSLILKADPKEIKAM